VEEQGIKLAKQQAAIDKLKYALNKQAGRLQQVSDRLETVVPAPRLVENP
jgi:hypothetical protein